MWPAVNANLAMTLASMTGFARAQGAAGAWRWSVEIKCVNAKGLDLRLRIPPGYDRIEEPARTRLAKQLARGTVFANVSATREGASITARVDNALLAEVAAAARAAAERFGLAPPTLDGLLAVRGIVEAVEAEDDEATKQATAQAMLATLDEAVIALVAARRAEGEALRKVLAERLESIAALTQAADDNPARKPEAVRARLAAAIAALTGRERSRPGAAAPGGDPAGGQGRHPRGTGPAEGACRRRARLARPGRPGRTTARFPRPGIRPRGEYALRQVERRQPDDPGARIAR